MKARTRAVRTYDYLKANYFTHREAAEFSILHGGISDPTLKLIIRDRAKRRRGFERRAVNLLDKGKWRDADLEKKWVDYLAGMYRVRKWTVQFGPTGFQQRMRKGEGNPWALYRYFEKLTPERRDGYVSPWRLKVYYGKSRLEKGLIFIKRLERGKSKASYAQILLWVGQKEEAVRKTHDKRRKNQLRREIRRLEALL